MVEEQKRCSDLVSVMDLEDVYEGIARAFYVSAWGDKEEEKGRCYPGQDLMDIAPETPEYVVRQAYRFVGHLEAINSLHIASLLAAAIKADLHDGRKPEDTVPDGADEYARLFGHYLAMEGMGHGVCWWDDHAEFDLKVPHFEFSQFDLE
jgi:hypothetical protein